MAVHRPSKIPKVFMKRDVRDVYLSKVTWTVAGNMDYGTHRVKFMSNHGKQEVPMIPSESELQERLIWSKTDSEGWLHWQSQLMAG